jgi:hypothetical protein
MTFTTFETPAFRAVAAALTLGLLPMAAAPAQASPLSDCYDYIMSECPTSLTPYEQCIGEGFDLCDNQHEQPLETGALDLNFLPWDQRRVVIQILRERDVPRRVYATPINTGDRGGEESGRGGGDPAAGR